MVVVTLLLQQTPHSTQQSMVAAQQAIKTWVELILVTAGATVEMHLREPLISLVVVVVLAAMLVQVVLAVIMLLQGQTVQGVAVVAVVAHTRLALQ